MHWEYDWFGDYPVDFWLRVRLSGDNELRWEAIDAIRHLCEPKLSVPLFIDTLLHDSYECARWLAAHALYDLAIHREYRSLLRKELSQLHRAESDPSAEVRIEVCEMISILSTTDGE